MKLSFRLSLLFSHSHVRTSIHGQAQELVKITGSTADETNVTERVRLLEAELERQNAKLDQLQKTITEQQSAIQALLEKLSVNPSLKSAPFRKIRFSSGPRREPSRGSEPPPQAPSVEQRLAKLEGQALKIGPVRFSGDFRIRYDGTFRSATEPPDPPLDHVQNSRGRYRLRLNFDTDIHPNLSFHGQLATGPLNNQVSTNQDFTSITRASALLVERSMDRISPDEVDPATRRPRAKRLRRQLALSV